MPFISLLPPAALYSHQVKHVVEPIHIFQNVTLCSLNVDIYYTYVSWVMGELASRGNHRQCDAMR